MTARSEPVAVLGAGIIGVCIALHLQRDGRRVMLLDRRGPGEGASKGNAALVAPDACVPVATPAVVRRVPRMLADPLAPLTIRWRYLPRLAPWLWQFVKAGSPRRVEHISVALRALLVHAIEAYVPLLRDAGLEDRLRRTGRLVVFESPQRFAAAQADLALQRRRGARLEVVPGHEIRKLEPSLAPIYERGVFLPESAYVTDNYALVTALAERFVRAGGVLLSEEARDFEIGTRGVTHVVTDRGRHAVGAAVVACGAWSKALAARLGDRPLLDTERGYHVTFADPGVVPRLPVQSGDHGFAVTPLTAGLRFAGTVELGGLAAPPNFARAQVLVDHGRRMFPGLDASRQSRWMGFRPSMPDSVPVIGASRRHANAFFAFGHGHLGLTLGAVTGRIVADLVAGRDPGLDMTPYRIDRF